MNELNVADAGQGDMEALAQSSKGTSTMMVREFSQSRCCWRKWP